MRPPGKQLIACPVREPSKTGAVSVHNVQIAGLEAELEKAHKQREAALTGDARAFAQAQSTVGVLEEAIEELRERLAHAEAEAHEAEQAKERAATIVRLVQTSKEAAAARAEFEATYREAAEALETCTRRLRR